jgi:hypothetical protein
VALLLLAAAVQGAMSPGVDAAPASLALVAVMLALSTPIIHGGGELEQMLSDVVEKHTKLEAEAEATRKPPEPERPCSRAGFIRSLAALEARYLKPWELCEDCDGDLLAMFQIRCFEPGGIATTERLARLPPDRIRGLMNNPRTRDEIGRREKFGEQPAAVCLAGCKPGFRPTQSVGSAYLVYECQNISHGPPPDHPGAEEILATFKQAPKSALVKPGQIPLWSPSWMPPRAHPGGFSSAEQQLLAALKAGVREIAPPPPCRALLTADWLAWHDSTPVAGVGCPQDTATLTLHSRNLRKAQKRRQAEASAAAAKRRGRALRADAAAAATTAAATAAAATARVSDGAASAAVGSSAALGSGDSAPDSGSSGGSGKRKGKRSKRQRSKKKVRTMLRDRWVPITTSAGRQPAESQPLSAESAPHQARPVVQG